MTSNVASNSSTTPLPANSTFFGFWTSVGNFSAVNALVSSNVAGEVFIQFSTTRQNVDFEVSIPVSAGETQTLSQTILAPYFRIKYANSNVTQTSFLLWTTLSTAYPTEVAVAVDLDAETSSVAVWGQKPDTTLSALQLDASGNLKTTATLSVDGTLNVSDETTHELLTDLSGSVWENTDRLLVDLDIIANHGTDASANALALISAVETQTTDLSNALTAVIDGLQDISGTVSVSNQITGFATSAKQDSMLSDLDGILNRLHDISGSVEVSNFPTLQMTKDASAIEQLELVNFNIQDLGDKYLFKPTTQPAQIDFDTYSASLAQGSTWSIPADGQPGWQFNKTASGGASLYTYANSTLVAGGQEDNMTLGSVLSMFFVANYPLVFNAGNDKQFYLSIYTKPTGSGDAGPFYKSRKTFVMPSATIVSKGGDRFYFAQTDTATIRTDLEHIQYELAVQEGTCADDEIVQFMALQADSAVPVGQFSGIVKMAGYVSVGNTAKVVEFVNTSRELTATNNLKSLVVSSGQLAVKDASAVALLAEIANGITVEVGEVDISGATFTDSKLNVFDASANSELTTIREIIDDTLFTVNFGLLNDIPTYAPIRCDASGALLVKVNNETSSSEVDISGASFTENKLNVFDASASSHLSVIEEILENGFVNVYDASCELVLTGIKTQTDKLSFLNEGTFESLRVRVEDMPAITIAENQVVGLAPNSSIAVSGEVSLAFGTLVGIDTFNNSVTVSNEFATESTVDGIKTQTDKLTFVDIEENTNNLKVIDVALNQQLSQFSFITKEGEEVPDLRVRVMNTSLDVTGTFFQETQPVSVADPVDTHLYGVHNGDWTAVKVAANGHLLVNSSTQDGDGNDITSTSVSGTETYTALDVKCRGDTAIINTDATAIYIRPRDSLDFQVATNASVTGPMRIGNANADTQGYTYISAIMSFTSVTVGGNVFLEVSHDGSVFARPSGASTFVNTSVSNVTASILLSTPVPFRYARLFADTGFNSPSVNAWIVMK